MLPEFEYRDFNEVRTGDLVQAIRGSGLSSVRDLRIVQNVVEDRSEKLIVIEGLPGRWTKDYFSLVKIKPISEVQVGDYMFRKSLGTKEFPKHTTIIIKDICSNEFYYSSGYAVLSGEVIVPYLKTKQAQKEQKPMKKLQDILNQIFGITDYEQKPNYLVVVYSADGAEIAQTIATNIEEVESKFKTTPSLIGCTAVCYKATTEITTEIPVVTTKLKDKHDNK